MRVTHVIKSTSLLGVERQLAMLLEALPGRGVEADLVVLAPPGAEALPLVDLARHKGIPTRTERVPALPSAGTLGSLTEHFKARRPEVVHLHFWEAEAYGLLAARRAGVRRVVGSGYEHPGGALPWSATFPWLRRQVWARLDRLVAVNQGVYDRALALGLSPAQVALVPYGVEADACHVGKGARTVLNAELGLEEGAFLAGIICALDSAAFATPTLEALWHLSAQRADAHLLIVGDGPAREALERLARGYRIADRVHFLGWREDAQAIIAALDVLLVTCPAEDPTVLLLEAAALQTPVIATAGEGASDLVREGETGLLVSAEGGADQLTSSLMLLLEEPALRHQLAARAQADIAGRFGFEPMVRGMVGVYESLVGG